MAFSTGEIYNTIMEIRYGMSTSKKKKLGSTVRANVLSERSPLVKYTEAVLAKYLALLPVQNR